MRFRQLKAHLQALLCQDDFEHVLPTILTIPGRQAVNPLFSFLYAKEERLRWRAVTAMGAVVEQLANDAMESARVVMRRLMWNLNDESGGIGWGSPEVMGESTARHAGLAAEYSAILVSYINPKGNYLEHEMLQRGSLWGVGRLAHARPDLTLTATSFLPAFFDSPDPYLRGMAIWAAGPLMTDSIRRQVERRISDIGPLRLYFQGQIRPTTVGMLASRSLAQTDRQHTRC